MADSLSTFGPAGKSGTEPAGRLLSKVECSGQVRFEDPAAGDRSNSYGGTPAGQAKPIYLGYFPVSDGALGPGVRRRHVRFHVSDSRWQDGRGNSQSPPNVRGEHAVTGFVQHETRADVWPVRGAGTDCYSPR
jgi:hypothetical protein